MRYLVRALFYLLIIMEVIQLKCKCHARRRYDQHTSLVVSVVRDTNIPRCKPYTMAVHAKPFNLYFYCIRNTSMNPPLHYMFSTMESRTSQLSVPCLPPIPRILQHKRYRKLTLHSPNWSLINLIELI